jgi:hypothetical protein
MLHLENERKLHTDAQKNYRKRKSERDPQYRAKINEYMKNTMKKSRTSMH